MKGLFCYDGPISSDSNGNYYGTVLNNDVFKRYFSVVSSLDIAIRVENEIVQNLKSSQITLENIRVTEIPSLSSATGFFRKKEAIKKLLPLIIEADVIFIRLPSFIGNIAVDLAKEQKKPYLIEMVGCPWDSLWNHSFRGKIIAPYMLKVTKDKLKKADKVVYVTNSFLQKRYPTNGFSVNCSNVELPYVNQEVLKKRQKKINNFSGEFVIGTAAAVNVRYKGQQYVIEAISQLKKEGIYCEYQLVGWGDQTYLREKAKEFDVEDRIKFIGTLSHQDIFEWLDTIDVYVQPSQQEGLPRALIEAMSRGCPSIGAKTGGIPELLEEEYIFTNSKSRITEIVKIIKSLNRENMMKQSSINFDESKLYTRDLIQKRRDEIFGSLRSQVR